MYPGKFSKGDYYLEGNILATRGMHRKYGLVWFIYDGDDLIAIGRDFKEAVGKYLAYKKTKVEKKVKREHEINNEELFHRERLEYERRLREGFWRPRAQFRGKQEEPVDYYEKYREQEERRKRAKQERYNQKYKQQSSPQKPLNKEITPYDTLGVASTASLKSIKKAWRKILTRCHPDKFSNKGEKLRKKAEEITKAVNNAYQEILRLRGKD